MNVRGSGTQPISVIEPYMPARRTLRRPRATDLRAVLDAISYIARTGCQWRLLPKDFPPFTTVQVYFYDWRDSGLFERINLVGAATVSVLSARSAPVSRSRQFTR
jgi:transposase